MIYITLALWAEGPSDGPFLRPLIRRVVAECILNSRKTVDIGEEFITLRDINVHTSRDKKIVSAVEKRPKEISILFIHSDTKGNLRKAYELNIKPSIEAVSLLPYGPKCIAVMPKHETEAWILSDRQAIANALGVNPDALINFPDISTLESNNDPKLCLENIRKSILRPGRRPPNMDLRQIGEGINLDLLRHLEAFRYFENSLLHLMREESII